MASRPLLYYITDRTQFPGDELARRHALLEKIREAAFAGVDYIQLREKDLTARRLQELAKDVVHVIRQGIPGSGKHAPATRLLINSRTDVALAVGADGVHLRSDDLSPAEVRRIAQVFSTRNPKLQNRNFAAAVSCHSEEEVMTAAKQAADFVVFAPVFEKVGVSGARAAGLDQLRRACVHRIPVFALGGVTIENAASCLAAGAAGLAGIRLFQQNSIGAIVMRLCRD